MANKCLQTKLKSVVENSNLKKLGIVEIPVNAGLLSVNFVTDVAGESKLEVIDSVTGVVVASYDSTTTTVYRVTTLEHEGIYRYYNKYAVKTGFVQSNIPYITYLPSIDEFLYCSKLMQISSNTCYGPIEKVAVFDNMSRILNGSYFLGDVTDYINARISRGFSSGSVEIYIGYGDHGQATLTINNVKIINHTISASATFEKLCWENANKYYYLYANRTKVYIHGYTDEEISTMRLSGGVFENITNNDDITKV